MKNCFPVKYIIMNNLLCRKKGMAGALEWIKASLLLTPAEAVTSKRSVQSAAQVCAGKCDCLSLGHSSRARQTEALLLGSLAQRGLCRHLSSIACLDMKAGGRASPHACFTCKQVVTIEKSKSFLLCDCVNSLFQLSLVVHSVAGTLESPGVPTNLMFKCT